MLQDIFNDYKQLGIRCIPIQWDLENNQPVSHRLWSEKKDFNIRSNDNALMVETGNNWGCLDFDLKNTKDKEIFNKWMQIVSNSEPEILSKCFIEKTRKRGYNL